MDNGIGSFLGQRNSSPCTDFISIAMNKFLKKQRSTDGPAVNDDAFQTLSQPASPGLKKSSTSRWKKNKKQPEVKPQLDLSIALPSSEEFRTSLIMPSLSTRFSMLREQDDPTSKLGKASDDSVLQPRRKSRMADFGYSPGALFDIAEVSSIHGSMRPPATGTSRQHSFVSDEAYSSDAEVQPSVMSRSRPGEGNILFGGRQKIYKIPTSGANSTKSLGRMVYDDDMGMSAFQKYRVREREADESHFPRPSDESQGFDFGIDQAGPGSRNDGSLFGLDTLHNDSAKDLSHSPSLSSYDKKRSTTSSTARSEARSSTAATSVASQPTTMSAQPSPAQGPTTGPPSSAPPAAPSPVPSLDRPGMKPRRLYEQGLDQHMQEQQTSNISRLNSIQRQRGLSVKGQQPHLHSARSAGNFHDRSVQPVHGLRSQSPLTSPLPMLNTGVKSSNSGASSPIVGVPQSPAENHWDENKVLIQALEPADRGKATAMGAFNKPAQAFDETQYLERQKALQRSTSNAVKQRSESRSQSRAAQERVDEVQEIVEETSPNPETRSRSESVPKKHEPTKAYNVFQNAVNQYAGTAPVVPAPTKSPLPDTHRTFFGNISASEDEDEDDDIVQSFTQADNGAYSSQGRWQPTQLQPVSEHPALRSQKSKASLAEDSANTKSHDLKSSASSRSLRYGRAVYDTDSLALDSPTLGPQSQPLNGMVHHLRQESNHSSVYPADEFALNDEKLPELPDMSWNSKVRNSDGHAMMHMLDGRSLRDSSYAVSNPWDLDEQSIVGASATGRHSAFSPIDEGLGMDMSSSTQSRQSDVSIAQGPTRKTRPPFAREDSEVSLAQDDVSSWQHELRKQHSRDASTATQQERDAFANELAARRAAIQENMKSIVERDNHSRGTSPAARALGALRTKASRESVGREIPSKAAKVLGSSRSNSQSRDVSRTRGNSSPRPALPSSQHPAFKAEGPGPSNGPCRDMDPVQVERMLASNRTTVASGRGRSRSNSQTTAGRSRSRTGPYRDDLEKAMVEGHGTSSAALSPEMTPFPAASPDIMSHLDYDYDGNRNLNYFDQQSTNSSTRQGASPITVTPNGYTPGRPVPIANAYSQNTTPPLTSPATLPSATYTPIVPSSARGPGLRKKTISKHDISEPTLLSSTSNVDTVDLPPGASLKNGMEDAPPIPPINPRRRATRKLFSRHRSDSAGDHEPRATVSDPNLLLNTSPQREYHFQPSPVVRMPTSAAASPSVPQQGFNLTGSPERTTTHPRATPIQRSVTSPMQGGMF